MRQGSLLLLPLLLGCVGEPSPSTRPPYDLQELATRAPGIGALVRAVQLCGLTLSQPAQERAAQIEAAAIELHQHQGGTLERDAFLRGMAPPRFDPPHASRDRAAWCAAKRPEVQQMDAMLNGADGTALVQRAEAAQASFR